MGFPLVRILAVLDSILARGAHPGLEAVLDGLTEPAPAEQEAPAPPPPEPAKEARNECVICLSAPCTRAVIPCGHQSLCEDCVGMAAGMGECPVCRGEWKGTLRIFQA
ncbi:hypothetical protein DFJ74DRAFT_652904 [Hyaloraphidium curvatum]|nr:hypothetical protein DFJ74DRAFT_652904 [Hyaloraphidium curvatum]